MISKRTKDALAAAKKRGTKLGGGSRRCPEQEDSCAGCRGALKAAGCERIFSEKVSGKSTNSRREFDMLMKALLPGDVGLGFKPGSTLKLDTDAYSDDEIAMLLEGERT